MSDAADQCSLFYEGSDIDSRMREYLLSVTCAAILASILSGFFDKKGSVSTVIKILCGVFVTLAVIRPVFQLDIPDITTYLSDLEWNSSAVTQQGILDAAQAQSNVIQQQAEAYVYDKAAQLGCEIQVIVTLNPEAPYQPISAQISGAVSPYAKSALTAILTEDLGIQKEAQQWIS